MWNSHQAKFDALVDDVGFDFFLKLHMAINMLILTTMYIMIFF